MKPSENHSIDLLNRLATSLMEEIKQVETFRGRWSVIKTKLGSLPPLLTDLSDFPNTDSNPLSTDLFRSISETLTDALTLVGTCRTPNPASGKLKTQSDIDAVAAKLGQHINDCDLLVKSGVLEDAVAVVGGSNKRECVRVQARNLITRLQIGDFESKRSAMDSLINLLHEDDKNVVIAVAQGGVSAIVGLMDSSCVDLREKAVSAISRVSAVDSSRHVLVAEGVLLLNHLVRVLECGSGFAKEKACVALQSLSLSKENARGLGVEAGFRRCWRFVKLARRSVAAGVLRNLAGFDEIKVNFVEEGAVSVLIGLAGSGTAIAQENSIGCLSNLVSGDENLKVLVAREGGIECLKNYWDAAAPMAKSLEVAVALLWNLVSYRPIAEVVASEGFIPRLVGALSCGILGVRNTACRAACDLGFNSKTRKEIGECGCIALLVRMLEAKSVEEKECAAKALASLMQFVGNRRIYRKEERGIVGTVQLLDPSIHNLDKKYPISILLSVVQSKKCRKRMIDAGACAFLPKLVEMEVGGAKKLLEGLEKFKVWGLFPIS
ncbi:LOW QUALITY PROTEIN: hypothetical protein Scep_020910 [Stephania cephalantha]|uniref:DUF7032 domain-containing protein n=1 Tax=Stephania cephalantha TaxID=152367 RepID=A0AAP0F3L2_9MAGN